MEKIKQIFVIVLVSLALNLSSQNNEIIRPGLIRAMATLSPSKMLSDRGAYFYLHGNLEGYLSKNISVCGEGYYFLGSQNSNSNIDFMHNLFYGFSYHVIKNNHDLYFGIQSGMAFVKLKASETGLTSSSLGADPVFSTIAGYNFYVNKVFHFFIQSRIIIGEHNYDQNKNISEFRFSAGLGFNINAVRVK